ncbi:MAG: PQQ-binding-like beta-propeller repeat protein, partial [bacterium]
MKRYMAKYAILLLLLLARGVFGASNWAMQGADVRHSGATSLTVPTIVPSLQWSARLGISARCTPVMSPDNLFAIVGTDDGKLVWVRMADGFTHADDATIPVYNAPSTAAFRRTPLVVATTAVNYQVFASNSDGRLYCVDILNNLYNASWMAPAAGATPFGPLIASPLPLTIGGVAYICVASTDGNLYLVNVATHATTKWFTAGGAIESTPTLGTAKPDSFSAALAEDMALGQNYARVLESERARFTAGMELSITDATPESFGPIASTAFGAPNGTINFNVAAANPHTIGALLVARPQQDLLGALAIGQTSITLADVSIFTVGDSLTIKDAGVGDEQLGTITAVNSVTKVITFTTGPANVHTAAAGVVFTVTHHQPLYFGCNDGRIYAINADELTTHQRWVVPAGQPNSGYLTALTLQGDYLYASERNGMLRVINADTGFYQAGFSDTAYSSGAVLSSAGSDYLITTLNGNGVVKTDITDPLAIPAPARFTGTTAPSYSSAVTTGDAHVLITTEDGTVVCLKMDVAAAAPLVQLWATTPYGAPLNGSPIVADNDVIIAVSADGYLLCWKAGGTAIAPTPGKVPTGQWPMFQHDPAHTGGAGEPAGNYTAPTDLGALPGNKLRWANNTGGSVLSTTAVTRNSGETRYAPLTFTLPAPIVGLRGASTFAVSDATHVLFHVGDPVVIPLGSNQFDDLGQIIAISRGIAGAPDYITTTYGPAFGHLAGENLQVSLFRRDNLLGGQSSSYGNQTKTVTPRITAGDIWYDANPNFNPSVTRVSLYSRLVPHFTDVYGQEQLNFLGAYRGQSLTFGFMDSTVKNPANALSPVDFFLYLTDDGQIGLRRNLTDPATVDPQGIVTNLPGAAAYPQSIGVDVMLTVGPDPLNPGQAIADVWYRLATNTGGVWAFPRDNSGYVKVTGTLPLPIPGDTGVLGTHIYPFFRGYDYSNDPAMPNNGQPGYTPEARGIVITRAYNPADAADLNIIGPGTTAFTVQNGGRLQANDLITITDPLTGVTEKVKISSISNRTVHVNAGFTNYYSPGADIRVGQPGEWAAYYGSDDGILRAVNPDTGALYWQHSALGKLGAVRGAPAIDSVNARVYVNTVSGRLFAFAQNGLYLWAYPNLRVPALAPATGSPVIDTAGNVYFTCEDGTAVKVTPEGEGTSYKPSVTGIDAFVNVGGPALLTAPGGLRLVYGVRQSSAGVQSGRIIALNTVDMTAVWNYITAGPISASPVVGLDGTVYVGDSIGNVYAVYESVAGLAVSRWLDGAVDYAFPTSGGVAIDVAGALGGDTLYVGDRNGTIHAITGGPDKTALSERSFTLDGPITGPLTLDASGNILVSTGAGSVFNLGRADSWATTARNYPGLISVLPTATKEGTLTPATPTLPVYDIAGGTITLSGRVYPRFVTDAGSPLTSFAGGGNQEARFGLQDEIELNPGDAASRVYFYLYVTDDGKLSMRRYVHGASAANLDPTVIGPVNLPAAYALANGIELQLQLSATTATGYYRLANADGIFTGNFNLIGTYALATAATQLSPMLQGADLSAVATDQQAFTITSSGITLYQGNTPAGAPTSISPAVNWVWNVRTNGAMPVAKPFHTAPTLYQGSAVIVGGDDGTVYAIGPDGSAGAAAPQPDGNITQPASLWPFFHRDGYREGNLATVNPAAPGPQQPTERWYADTRSRLSSSPVVTVNTPDRVARVYQGAEDGNLYGFNASTGAQVWKTRMPYKGGIQATPAVGADGSIAVAALDGRVYLFRTDTALLVAPALSAVALPSAFPVVTRTMAAPTYVHNVTLQTNDPGTLSIVDAAGKSRDIQTYPGPGTGRVTITVDEIVNSLTWTPATPTPLLFVFDVDGNLRWDSWSANITADAAGTVSGQQYIKADDTAFAAQTAPFTDTKVIARFTTPTFVGYANFTTANAGTISVRGADDKVKTLLTITKSATDRAYKILVNRQVKEIIWTTSEATSTVAKFDLFAPFTPGNFVSSPVRGSDGTVYAATTDALHRLALAADARDGGKYFTDEAGTIALVEADALKLQDGDESTTVSGNGILVYSFKHTTNLSRVILVTPNSGRLSVRVGGVKELLATYGTGDDTRAINVPLNRKVEQVIWENSSPLLDARVSEFECYTTDGVLRDDGKIFVQDETAPATMTGKTIEARLPAAVVSKVIINTGDAGVLRFYDNTGSELAALCQTLTAGAPADQTFALAGLPTLTAVKWTADGSTSSITKFELYDAANALLATQSYYVYDPAIGVPYTVHHAVEMNFRDADNAAISTYVQRVFLATSTAGTVTVYDTNGAVIGTPTLTTADVVARRYEIAIGRLVGSIHWEATAGSGDITEFTAYTGAGQVYAFDATTGKMKWRSDNISPVWGSPAVAGGAVTTDHPADVVYVATADGQVYAFNGDDGSPHWSQPKQTANAVLASVVLIDKPNTACDVLVSDSLGMLYQYDGAVGTLKGSRNLNTPLTNTPVVNASGTIFVVSDAGQIYHVTANLGGSSNSVNLNATVKSSPVLDSQGHLYVSTDDGTLVCVDPLANTLLWSFPADRTVVSTTLAVDIINGTSALPVSSIGGFRVGDAVKFSSPDGSNVVDLGTVVGLTPPSSVSGLLQGYTAPVNPDAAANKLLLPPGATLNIALGHCHKFGDTVDYQVTDIVGDLVTLDKNLPAPLAFNEPWVFTSPMAINQVNLRLNDVSNMTVGSPISILPWYDKEFDPQPSLISLGSITAIDSVNNIISLDRPLLVTYPLESTVFSGTAYGVVRVSRYLSGAHSAGDLVRVVRVTTTPLRTSPAVGPEQTVYIGANDGMLYAVGPVGPAGFPQQAAPIVYPESDSIWYTFHRNNQRTGYAGRPGPTTSSLRWYQGTRATLDSSPAIGYAEAAHPLGVLYQGMADVPDANGNIISHGALSAFDAALGTPLWQFTDSNRLGRVISSPTVVSIKDQYSPAHTGELIVFGTAEIPTNVMQPLVAGIGVDNYGNETPVALTPGQRIVSVQVPNAGAYPIGSQIYLADDTVGTNYEIFGVVGSRSGNTLRLYSPHVVLRNHNLGSMVAAQPGQQGRVYAVNRAGAAVWTFPRRGAAAIGVINSSPAVSLPVVTERVDQAQCVFYITTDDDVVYAIDFNGNERWHYAIAPTDSTETFFKLTSATLSSDGTRLYIGISVPLVNRGYVIALDTTATNDDERLLWRTAQGALAGPVTSAPLLTTIAGAPALYVGTDNYLPGGAGTFYQLNPDDGAIITSSVIGPIAATAAAVPESNFFNYAVKAVAGNIFTLDQVNGLVPGMHVTIPGGITPVTAEISAVNRAAKMVTLSNVVGVYPPVISTLRSDEQVIIVGDLNGRVTAFTPALAQLWTYQTGGPILTSPAISGEISTPFSEPKFTGTGLNDIRPAVEYTGLDLANYTITISAVATGGVADKFTWSDGVANGVLTISGELQSLNNGVSIRFPALSGHVLNDSWTFTAYPYVRNYTAYVGSNDHNLTAITFFGNTNAVRWQKNMRDKLVSSPVVGMRSYGDGRALVYQTSRDQYLYAFGSQYEPTNPNGVFSGPDYNPNPGGGGDVGGGDVWSSGGNTGTNPNTFPPAPTQGGTITLPNGTGGLPWDNGSTPTNGGGTGTPGTTDPNGPPVNNYKPPVTQPIIIGGIPQLDPTNPVYNGKKLVASTLQVSKSVEKYTGNPWIHAVLPTTSSKNDMTIVSAPLTGPTFTYIVKISTVGANDTIAWSVNGGPFGADVPIPPANTAVDLGNGVQIAFDSITGHGLNSTWTFNVPDKDLWNGASGDSNWWKFSINVKNVGQGPIDTIDIQDILPEVLMDPNYTPFIADSNWVTKVSPTTNMDGPITYSPFGAPAINDMKLVGGIALDTNLTLMVKIATIGAVDTIVWSTDAGGTWSAPPVPVSTDKLNPNLLPGGVRIVFAALTGHAVGDIWTFTNYPRWQLNFHDQFGQRFILWPEDTGNRNQGFLSELHISFIARVRDGIPENNLELATVTADQTDPKVLAVSDVTALRKGQRIVIGDNDVVLRVNSVDPIQKTITIAPDDSARTWANLVGGVGSKIFLATKTKPTLKDSVMGAGTEMKESGAHSFLTRANLYLQLFNHPVPMEMGGSTMANNQLFVSANTYDGDNTKNKSLIQRKETPVQNGWTGTFKVRMYYNGFVNQLPNEKNPNVLERNLTRLGPGAEPRAFSPYNQTNPETGQPLTFVVERNLNVGDNQAVDLASLFSHGEYMTPVDLALYDMQQSIVPPPTGRVATFINDNGSVNQFGILGLLAQQTLSGLNTATSGFEIPLTTDDIQRYDRTIGGIGGLVKSLALPYAWRVTIQQARTKMNQRVPNWGWGKEVPFIDRAVQGARVSVAAPISVVATTVTLTKPATPADEARFLMLKNHRVLFHHPTANPTLMSDVEAFVTGAVIGNADATLTLTSLTRPLAVDATVRDEWAPDFIVTNPANVSGLKTDGSVLLGAAVGQTPEHNATTPVITIKNNSLIDALPNTDMFRLLTIPSDLRTGSPSNWNVNLIDEYALGKPGVQPEWAGFQYDPYLENHLPLRQNSLSIPFGSGLNNRDSYKLRISSSLPAHQSNGSFTTTQETKPTLLKEAGTGIIYWETNNIVGYQPGKDFRLDDINNSGAWDANEMLFLDTYGDGIYRYGEATMAYSATDTRIFMDLNGNRVWDYGEPFYMTENNGDVASLDMTTPYKVVSPNVTVTNTDTTLRPITTMADAGKIDARTTIRLPYLQPIVENAGNVSVSSATPGNWSGATDISPVGISPTHKAGGNATDRNADEINPYNLSTYSVNPNWALPKSPAGSELNFRRPFTMPIMDEHRLAAGTYTGRFYWGSNDPMYFTMRIAETRLSQVAPDATVPPAFDTRSGGPAGWTNNLTGMESWPTSAVLPNGDLGVWVASNTPLAPATLPSPTTDTTIWYREARRLTASVLAIGATSITVDTTTAALVHGDNTGTGDLLILRKRPVLGETQVDPGAAPAYAVVQSVNTTTGEITLTAAPMWVVPAAETVVEIMGHPWVPVVTANDMLTLANALKDPNSAYVPTPIICTSPAVTPDGTGKFWLTFTVSAVRQITRNTRSNFIPTSYIAYKLFDPANPQTDGIKWIGAPDSTTFPQRDKAIWLKNVDGQTVVIYEAGATGGRGLYAASTTDPTTGLWQMDIPLNAYTWSFTSVGRPQAWVEGGNILRLVFQASRADGNTDIYSGQLTGNWDGANNKMSFSAQPLILPEAPNQSTGIIS